MEKTDHHTLGGYEEGGSSLMAGESEKQYSYFGNFFGSFSNS